MQLITSTRFLKTTFTCKHTVPSSSHLPSFSPSLPRPQRMYPAYEPQVIPSASQAVVSGKRFSPGCLGGLGQVQGRGKGERCVQGDSVPVGGGGQARRDL